MRVINRGVVNDKREIDNLVVKPPPLGLDKVNQTAFFTDPRGGGL